MYIYIYSRTFVSVRLRLVHSEIEDCARYRYYLLLSWKKERERVRVSVSKLVAENAVDGSKYKRGPSIVVYTTAFVFSVGKKSQKNYLLYLYTICTNVKLDGATKLYTDRERIQYTVDLKMRDCDCYRFKLTLHYCIYILSILLFLLLIRRKSSTSSYTK